MAANTAQLVEDFSDPPEDESNPRAKSRRCRLIWFGSLAICPVLMEILGNAFARPVNQVFPNRYPWPAQAVDVLACVHLGLSAMAMVASIWVWGRHWWLGWAFVFLTLFLAAGIALGASMATTGLYP